MDEDAGGTTLAQHARDVTGAGEVFQEHDRAGAHVANFAIADLDLEVTAKVEVELATWARVPVAEPARGELEEQRALSRERSRDIERWGRRCVVDRLELCLLYTSPSPRD